MGMFDDLIPQKSAALTDEPGGVPQMVRTGMFDDLVPEQPRDGVIPRPGELRPGPPAARFGDFLKPVFGGRNPIAETYDIVAPALDPRSERGVVDRVVDTANFAVNAPFRALRLPGPSDAAAYFGDESIKASEDRFVENNPGLLRGLGALGEVAPGMGPLGQGYRMPQQPLPRADAAPPRKIAERAQEVNADFDAFNRQNVRPFGPAFSDGPSASVAKQLSETYVIGGPVRNALEDSIIGARDAVTRVADDIAPEANLDRIGSNVQRGLDRTRTAGVREIEPGVLSDRGIQPNAAVRPADIMSGQATQRMAQAEPVRQQLQGGQAQTSRGVNVPAAQSRNQTLTARRGIEDLSDAEVQRLTRSPAQDTSVAVRQEALYERARRQVPNLFREDGSRNPSLVPAVSTRGALQQIQGQLANQISGQGVIGGPLAERLMNARAGNFQLDDLFSIRREIGRALGNFGQFDQRLDRTQLRQLYGAISRDIEVSLIDLANRAYLRTQGSNNSPAYVPPAMARQADGALRAFRTADRYFRASVQRMERFEQIVGSRSPEQAVQRLLTAAADGTKGSIQTLRTARSVLRPEEWREFSSLVLRRLGEPLPSARGFAQETGFSVSTFVTNWSKLSHQAINTLFDGPQASAINDLVRINERLANVEALANTSRSATNASNLGAVTGGGAVLAIGGLPQLLGALGVGLAASVIMSRPAYARLMVNYANMRARSLNAPQLQVQANRVLDRLANKVRSDANLLPQEQQAVLLAVSQMQGGQQ